MINSELIEKMKKSPATGRPYSFTMETLFLIKDSKTALVDKYRYQLTEPATLSGDNIHLATTDLIKIFSPEMTFKKSGKDLRINFLGGEAIVPAGEKVSVKKLVCDVFGMSFDNKDDLFAFSYQPGFSISEEMVKYKKICLRGKTIGDFRLAYWNADINRINTYRIFIPSGYNAEVPAKLAICLHGAGGNSDSVFDTSENMISYFAEKYNYILLAPNSYVRASNYGGGIPPVGMFEYDPDKPASTDPGYYSRTVMNENKTSQSLVYEVIDRVFDSFSIDRSHVYIMGNSMGAIGTFHLVSERPGMFRAASPAGALPMLEYIDYDRCRNVPMLIISGTEDDGCAHYMKPSCDYMKKQGMDVRLLFVGGGNHKYAWTYEIEEIFKFFEVQC